MYYLTFRIYYIIKDLIFTNLKFQQLTSVILEISEKVQKIVKQETVIIPCKFFSTKM
jgi:hypothetical protein